DDAEAPHPAVEERTHRPHARPVSERRKARKLARPAARPTVGAVLGEVAKRVVNGAVLFIAAITFFLVPLGRKTLAQHVMAIFGTEPVREAAGACAEAG